MGSPEEGLQGFFCGSWGEEREAPVGVCVGRERGGGYAVLFRRFDPRARQQIFFF